MEKAHAFAQQAELRTVLFVDPRTGRHCTYDSVRRCLTENAAVDVDQRCGLDTEARRTAATALLEMRACNQQPKHLIKCVFFFDINIC